MKVHRWFSALAAAAVSGVVAAPATDAPVGPRIPPRMMPAAGGYEDCQVRTPQALGEEEEISARLTVASDGRLAKISLPESAPEWMVELTACVLRRTEFRAALRNGTAVESTANLFITIAAGAAGESTARVEKVGPLITPPALHRDDRHFLGCHPVGVDLSEASARQVVLVTILPDGSKGGFKLPAGAPEWLEGSALCVLSHVSFTAGTRDGQPVTSEATLPIVFADLHWPSRPYARITAPKPTSTEEEVESALRACYPSDLQTGSRVQFQFEIGAGGHVRNAELLQGSGDAQVDEVARCVLGKLKFTPLLRGNRRLASTVTWQLSVRPPRNP